MVSYLEEYLKAVLDFMEMDSQPGWGGKTPTAVALESVSRAVQQFNVGNAIQPDGEPLELPNEIKGTTRDYSVDGASCPHCSVVTLISTVVCSSCIEQLGDDAVVKREVSGWMRCFTRDRSEARGQQPLTPLVCHSLSVLDAHPRQRSDRAHKSRRPSRNPRESPQAQLQNELPSRYKYK